MSQQFAMGFTVSDQAWGWCLMMAFEISPYQEQTGCVRPQDRWPLRFGLFPLLENNHGGRYMAL